MQLLVCAVALFVMCSSEQDVGGPPLAFYSPRGGAAVAHNLQKNVAHRNNPFGQRNHKDFRNHNDLFQLESMTGKENPTMSSGTGGHPNNPGGQRNPKDLFQLKSMIGEENPTMGFGTGDVVTYETLVGVKPENIMFEQQPVVPMQSDWDKIHDADSTLENGWKEQQYIKVTNAQFEGWIKKKKFPKNFGIGIFAFISLPEEPETIRMIKTAYPGEGNPPGHSSMVSADHYKRLREGKAQMKYAGEILVEKGAAKSKGNEITAWSNGSGHFCPDVMEHFTFAIAWFLDELNFKGMDEPGCLANLLLDFSEWNNPDNPACKQNKRPRFEGECTAPGLEGYMAKTPGSTAPGGPDIFDRVYRITFVCIGLLLICIAAIGFVVGSTMACLTRNQIADDNKVV